MSCCCHYDEGWDEGYEAGRQAGRQSVPAGTDPLHAAYLLEAASVALYRADPRSLLALDCQQAADGIAQEAAGLGEWDAIRVRAAA